MPPFQKDGDYVDLSIEELQKPEFNTYIPAEIYHYTKLRTALEKILPDRSMFLGRITQTNDPRETKERFYHDVNWGTSLGFGNPIGTILGIENREVTGEWRVFCACCSHYPPSDFLADYALAQQSNILGDHHRYGMSYAKMWAQYGDNHSGICLVFDGQRLNYEIENRFKDLKYKIRHGFVRYDDALSVRDLPPNPDAEINDRLSDDRLRHYQDKYYAEYFLYKSREWQSEHEFRWLVHSLDRNEKIEVQIDNSIKAVIMGIDCLPVYQPSLQTLCDNLRIPLYKMRFLGGRPRADLVPRHP